jgi:hypothetical protein
MDYFVKPFRDTPEYIYNNPLKFLMNKLWEKYYNTKNLNKLNKEFTDSLVLDYDVEKLAKSELKRTLFLIFSDDIEWCKSNLDFIKNKIFISGNLDYQDLYLMSMCNHNIISNSSFSWWGAWLNNHKNKKVIYPSRWFNFSADTSEIGGENWIKI